MRAFDWVGLGTLIVLSVLVLVGCVSVNVVPTALPLPEAPEILFVPSDGLVCLSESEANSLGKYFDQLNAFRAAWERLRAE